MAGGRILAGRCGTHVHHRQRPHQDSLNGHKDKHDGLPYRGYADGSNQFLSVHRQGEGEHLPQSVTPTAVLVALAGHPAPLPGS